MIPARRLKRNFRRLMIPFETALVWIVGPAAAGLYWLFHGALHGARLATTLLTHWRF